MKNIGSLFANPVNPLISTTVQDIMNKFCMMMLKDSVVYV